LDKAQLKDLYWKHYEGLDIRLSDPHAPGHHNPGSGDT
jgi:hypothetical protein